MHKSRKAEKAVKPEKSGKAEKAEKVEKAAKAGKSGKAKKRGRGRPAEFPERLPGARLPEGSKARIKTVLRQDEGPGEFLRTAILKEIEAREGVSQGHAEAQEGGGE